MLLNSIRKNGVCLILVSNCSISNAACWDGLVSKVIDGDTLMATDTNETPHTIRLAWIDAPEISQPYGEEARGYLDRMSYHQPVQVCFNKTDAYHREIAIVTPIHDKMLTSYNLMLISQGYAWHYKHYAIEQASKERNDYANAETMARSKVLGLWAQQNPVEPWQYRHANKKQSNQLPD